MQPTRRFTFGSYVLDVNRSRVTFLYSAELMDGSEVSYTDSVYLPGVTPHMWWNVPEPLLISIFQSLSIMLGINYWKVHYTSDIHIKDFSLTREQAEFWNIVYTKGLGEFFYQSHVDFRGLVSFPYDSHTAANPTRFPRSKRSLLLNGGGKDSIVSAELLKDMKMSFDLFESNGTQIQRRVGSLIGRPSISFIRNWDPALASFNKAHKVPGGYPVVTVVTFGAIIASILHDYRYIILSSEQSSNIPNVNYLGLDVNHQWSKSSESERLVRAYTADFITPDIIPFSLTRQYTELEMVRRFAEHSKYFAAFSSCNVSYFLALSSRGKEDVNTSYWCKKCPKCVFIFACLSAFLPKDTVVGILGANLYEDVSLLPLFKQLLGIEGFKPFECVGTPEEMIVAMHRAELSHAYTNDPVMKFFVERISSTTSSFEAMERRVFSSYDMGVVPEEFTQ